MEQESPWCLTKENLLYNIMFLICRLFSCMVNQLRSQIPSQGTGISYLEPCFYICLRICIFEATLTLESGNMVHLLLIDEAVFCFCTVVVLIYELLPVGRAGLRVK